MCPKGYTGVDCAEGLPVHRAPEVDRRLAREQSASDYFDAIHLHDDVEEPSPADAALYASGKKDSCIKLWGKCRKGKAKSPRIFIYTLPGPMVRRGSVGCSEADCKSENLF